MGLRSDDPIGRSYAPRGKTPGVDATGQRFGCNMISAISNLGQLWFMVFTGRLDAKLFVEFLGRLLRAGKERKLFLVIDSHPAHKASKVKRWLEGAAVFFGNLHSNVRTAGREVKRLPLAMSVRRVSANKVPKKMAAPDVFVRPRESHCHASKPAESRMILPPRGNGTRRPAEEGF
jgi:hypothetical protein